MATRAEDVDREMQSDTERVPSGPATNHCSSSRGNRDLKSDDESWSDVLERSCSAMSDATTSEMVEVANSPESQQSVEDLLTVYFRTWQLRSTESILVFVLLSFSALLRDCSELKADRSIYEDHIARLKKRIGDLEVENDDLKKLQMLEERKKRQSPDKEGPASEHDRVTQRLQELMLENSRLRQNRDEVSPLPGLVRL